MKRGRLTLYAGIMLLLVALAWVLLSRRAGDANPPQASRPVQVQHEQQGDRSHLMNEIAPTQTLHRVSTNASGSPLTGEGMSASFPVPTQGTHEVKNPSNAQDAAMLPVSGEQLLPNESVPATRLDTDALATAISEYFRLFGVYPRGSNAAIAKALAGDNPRKVVLPTFKRVGKDGEMLDPWSNPYDIHIAEDGRLQIRSAGSNLVMGDTDDILVERSLTGKTISQASGVVYGQ